MNKLFVYDNLDNNSRIEIASKRLAILFLDDKDIPAKFKKGAKETQKGKSNSLVQRRFDSHVKMWNNTIIKIIENNKSELAWRFINIFPKHVENIISVTENNDFTLFTDYFVLRRDIQHCDDNEVGCLAQLYTAFQREIERIISINKPDFVAIDFEHATRNKGSVCSVGIVTFKDGEIVDEFYSLVKPPQNKYEWFTVRKHKLNSSDTENSPSFGEIYPEIKKRIEGNLIVAHGAFHTDKHCLEQAMEVECILDDLNLHWSCTQDICNSNLNVACKVCNIPLDHHQALSDAKACGFIYQLFKQGTIPVEKIQIEKERQKQNGKEDFFPKRLSGDVLKPDFENVKNKDNRFYMKKVVVSGFRDSEKERIAIELKNMGADVDSSVGKNTNYLIAGENVGPSKLKKMKENISDGKEASIINYDKYLKLIK